MKDRDIELSETEIHALRLLIREAPADIPYQPVLAALARRLTILASL